MFYKAVKKPKYIPLEITTEREVTDLTHISNLKISFLWLSCLLYM